MTIYLAVVELHPLIRHYQMSQIIMSLTVSHLSFQTIVRQINYETGGDDDFSEFQTAAPVPAPVNLSAPSNNNVNLFDLLDSKPPAGSSLSYIQPKNLAQISTQQSSTLYQVPAQVLSPNTIRQPSVRSMSPVQIGVGAQRSMPTSPPARSGTSSAFGGKPSQGHASKPSTGNFDDLWNLSLGSTTTKANQNATSQKSIRDIAKENANANIWGGAASGSALGSSSSAGKSTSQSSQQSGIDDLLF